MFRRPGRGDWFEQQAADWRRLSLPSGDALMAADLRDLLHVKQGRSIVRHRVRTGSKIQSIFLKRHYRSSWLAGLAASVIPTGNWSDARCEASHLQWAHDNGFRVPRVVAVGQKSGPGLKLQGYLALEELAGMMALHEAIPRAARTLPPMQFQKWKRGLTRALAAVVARLHGLRHFHKDLYLCHFFVPDQAISAEPQSWDRLTMIDLHRLGHHPWAAAWWRLKDLAQLMYSSDIEGVTARDRLRFLRCYSGAGRRSSLLRWFVGIRWRNYQRHNQRRVAGRAA